MDDGCLSYIFSTVPKVKFPGMYPLVFHIMCWIRINYNDDDKLVASLRVNGQKKCQRDGFEKYHLCIICKLIEEILFYFNMNVVYIYIDIYVKIVLNILRRVKISITLVFATDQFKTFSQLFTSIS